MTMEARQTNGFEQLVNLCSRELLNGTITKVSWLGFSDSPAISVTNQAGSVAELAFGSIEWKLVLIAGDRVLATSEHDFATFRPFVESCIGMTITEVSLREQEGLAMSLVLDDALRLQMGSCDRNGNDEEAPCWELFCSDHHVLVVGMKYGEWRRIRKNTPLWPSGDAVRE